MLIEYANPDLESIVAELEGIEGQITTTQVNYCEEKSAIRYTAPVMQDYFYGLQTHLHQVIEDIHLLIMESCTKAQKSKDTKET